MPALLVGASVDGRPNFMTVAWAGIANSDPPMISVAIRHQRYTLPGIQQNRVFSVNVPSADMAVEVDYCGITSGARVDKVKDCQFEVFYGKLDTAPLIEQCPVNLECRVEHILDLGSHALVVGRIEVTHVSESCLTSGDPIHKNHPLILGGAGNYYALGEMVAKPLPLVKYKNHSKAD
jgi:flavin reductase (DIM6/NTAB) family NADH-FMN oxidoreductase RutF